jgi:hypothetical protein
MSTVSHRPDPIASLWKFKLNRYLEAGTLERIDVGGDSVLCELVLLPNWKTKLATTLSE